MRTDMQQTSLLAYQVLREDETELGKRQKKVLDVIKWKGKATDAEIAQLLQWPINCVTGRRNELIEKGKIGECGVKINEQTGMPNKLWGVMG